MISLPDFVTALEQRDERQIRKVVAISLTERDLANLSHRADARYWQRRWQHRRAHLRRAAVRVLLGTACLLLGLDVAVAAETRRPTPIQYALSARLCGQVEWRTEMKHRVSSTLQEAKQHPGTVVDLRELASDQRSVREVEVAIRDTRAALRARRLAPVACDNVNVFVVEGCLGALVVGREATTAWWGHDDPALCTDGVKDAIAEARRAMEED